MSARWLTLPVTQLSIFALAGVDVASLLAEDETQGFQPASSFFTGDVGFAGACEGCVCPVLPHF
jgi:hypothetical protein